MLVVLLFPHWSFYIGISVYNQKFLIWLKQFMHLWPLFFPSIAYSSFIEATMGTAVVNDATATYFNPAALTLLKNSQIIGLGSFASFDTNFTGQSIQSLSGFEQSGSSSNKTDYYLPSLYMAMPSSEKITVGLAIISNLFNNNIDENSILRYAQSNNSIQNVDANPAIGIKLNKFISLGAGMIFSRAQFLLQPLVGFPSLNVPDTQSRNESSGDGFGGDAGILLTASPSTMIGFNYRSAITYRFTGTSRFESTPEVTSNNYSFTFWSPSRSVLTISHLFNPHLGFISTIQRIQWSIFDKIHIRGIATQLGTVNANIPFHLHDSWLFTVGGQYRINPKWVIRAASSYNQSSGNSHYQLANGDSIILGASTGYEIFKNIIIDGSYARAFIHDENINIATERNIITGVNKGSRDAVSLKLTFNL